MSKERIDILLVKKGFFETREKAAREIMAGNVIVNEVVILKPGLHFNEDVQIRVKDTFPYVSRGALKLKYALEYFNLPVKGKVALDIGASTGGFTEILLEKGAELVYAIDSGTNQLHWKLRTNPKVVVMEKTNARYLERSQFEKTPEIATVDVSFISLTKILLPLKNLLKKGFWIITLIKPQFELEREKIKKGGFVSEEYRMEAIDKVLSYANSIGLVSGEVISSPLPGYKSGNVEFLTYFKEKN
ncbi:MAG: TlyA family RNA methyltransferase [Brevinematia bacterium]